MKSSFLNDYTVAAEDAFNNGLGLVARVLERNLMTVLYPFKEAHLDVAKNIFETIVAIKEFQDYNMIHKKKLEDLITKQTYPENFTVERVKEHVMPAITSIINLKFVQDPFFKTMNYDFEVFKKEALLLIDKAIEDVIKEDITPKLNENSSGSEKEMSWSQKEELNREARNKSASLGM